MADIIRELKIEVDDRWRRFGNSLQVQPELLDDIHKNNNGNTSDCMQDLVFRWVTCQEGTGSLPRTWDTVVGAMRGAGLECLARELAETYCAEVD